MIHLTGKQAEAYRALVGAKNMLNDIQNGKNRSVDVLYTIRKIEEIKSKIIPEYVATVHKEIRDSLSTKVSQVERIAGEVETSLRKKVFIL